MNVKKTAGFALAVAAAGLFANVAIAAEQAVAEAKVKCEGINECKGHNSDACKGKGWLEVTKAECEAKGGKVVVEEKK